MKDIGALSTATFFFSLCMHLPHQVCLLHFSIVENTKHGIRIMLKKKRPTKSARPLFTILRHERNLKDKRTQSFRILIYHKFWEKLRDLKVIIFPKNKISANWDKTDARNSTADQSDNNNFAKKIVKSKQWKSFLKKRLKRLAHKFCTRSEIWPL